jgi:hypothetical protein
MLAGGVALCTHAVRALTPLGHSLAVFERQAEVIVKAFADPCVISYKGV